MPDERTAKIVLKYQTDDSSLKAAERGIVQIESRLDGLSKAASDSGSAARQAAQSIREAFKDPGSATLKRLAEERKALADTAAARKKLDDQRQKGANLTESVGKGSTALGGIASVVGRSAGLGGSLGGVGDILGAVENVSQFQQELKGLSEGLAQAGGLSGKFSGAVGGLSAVLGPASVALAAIGVGVKVWNDGLAAADVSVKRSSDQISQYFQIIQTGTTESIKAQIKALETQKALADAEIKFRQDNLKDVQDKNLEKARAELDFWGELSGELEQAGVRAGPLTQKIKELQDQSADAQAQIEAYKKALGDSGVATNTAAEAEQRLADARLKGIDKDLHDEIERQRLIREGTAQDVKNRVKNIEIERDATAAQIPVLEKLLETAELLGDSKAADAYRKQIEAYTARLKDLDHQQADLTNNVLPLIQARNRERQAVNDVKDAIDDLTGSARRLRHEVPTVRRVGNEDSDPLAGRRGKESTEAERAANEQITNENKKNDELIAIAERYDADIKQIEENSARERADLYQRYGDQLVDIARTAADAAADNLTKLQQSREDLARDFGRDEQKAERDAAQKALEIQINAAREEEQASRDHFKRLDQIRRDAQDRELEFLLDRNFLGLLTSRRQTARQIEDESGGFTERRNAAQEQLADLQRQIASERNERRIEYQQRLEDARLAFDRENAQIDANRQVQLVRAQEQYQRDLVAQQQKTAQELAIRQQAAADEIRLVNLTEAQKRAAYETSLAHARAFSQQVLAQQQADYQRQIATLNSMSSSARNSMAQQLVTRRAGGGGLGAGQTALVNDAFPGQRESFNGVPFPAGMGLFTPAQAGYVSPRSTSNRNLNATFNIQAHDTEGVRREVLGVLRQVMT